MSTFSHTVSLEDAAHHDTHGALFLHTGAEALSSSPDLVTGLVREGGGQRPATADAVSHRRRMSLRGVQHRSLTTAAGAHGAGAGFAWGMNNDGNSDSEVGYYSSGGYSATELSTPGSHDRSLYSIPGSPSVKNVGEASASPRWSRDLAEHTASPTVETIVARGRSIDSDGELGRPTTPTTRCVNFCLSSVYLCVYRVSAGEGVLTRFSLGADGPTPPARSSWAHTRRER